MQRLCPDLRRKRGLFLLLESHHSACSTSLIDDWMTFTAALLHLMILVIASRFVRDSVCAAQKRIKFQRTVHILTALDSTSLIWLHTALHSANICMYAGRMY